jgi:hypothetical protein
VPKPRRARGTNLAITAAVAGIMLALAWPGAPVHAEFDYRRLQSEFGIGRAQNISELARLGCETFLELVLRYQKPSPEVDQDGQHYKRYDFGEILISTISDEREIINSASVPIGTLKKLGLLSERMSTADDFMRTFGKPFRKTDNVLLFVSPKYETYTLHLKIDKATINTNPHCRHSGRAA